jgi:hypothetical protein
MGVVNPDADGDQIELTDRVLALCDRAADLLSPGPDADEVAIIRDKVVEPLRIAVAGRIKAGKSTLVNALLRQRVAAVAVGECTKVVTWFRYGHQERVDVHPKEGASWSIGLTPAGRLPERLGVDPNELSHITVFLSNETLRALTIIDTPGLDSLDTASSAATEDLLALGRASQRAVAEADALILLLPHLSRRDADSLTAFQSMFAGTGLSSATTIGVLSKADLVGDDEPLSDARRLAIRYEERLGRLVSRVIPVVGLLAETADADAFTEADAHDLRTLAALDPIVLDDALASADRFLDDDTLPVPSQRRQHLLETLDIYGIRRCVELLHAGHSQTSQLIEQLRLTSGIGPLRDALVAQFARRAGILKAHAALADLERISYRNDGPSDVGRRALRDGIEQLRSSPAMHQLREMEAARSWSAGELTLRPELGTELERVTSQTDLRAKLGLSPDTDDAECAAAAMIGAGTWLGVVNDPRTDPASRRAATTIHESYVIAWEHFDGA